MRSNSDNWNIISVSSRGLKEFKSILDHDSSFEYHILPASVTRNYTPPEFSTRNIFITPIFLKASLSKLSNFIVDCDYDDVSFLYDKCKPIDDDTMKLALGLSHSLPARLEILMEPFEHYAKDSKLSFEDISSYGSYSGVHLTINNAKCYCIPFGSQTLAIKEL